MSGFQNLRPDPDSIGRLRKPDYARLPDPSSMFRLRAERLAVLARENELGGYLTLLGALCGVQSDLAAALPPAEPIPGAQVARARENAMPPLDRRALEGDPAMRATLDAFLEAAAALPMPDPAADALDRLRRTTPGARAEVLGNVLADAIPAEALPQHLFASAGAQIHAARLAASLDAEALVPLRFGLCPVCGGPPVASLVVGHPGAEGARYAACAFCGTQWNEVRIRWLACGSTKGIGYRSSERAGPGSERAGPGSERAGPGEGASHAGVAGEGTTGEGTAGGGRCAEAVVKAEICDSCHAWVKILDQRRVAAIDAVADDVASLGLDLLMRGTDYRRAGFNPFLLGY